MEISRISGSFLCVLADLTVFLTVSDLVQQAFEPQNHGSPRNALEPPLSAPCRQPHPQKCSLEASQRLILNKLRGFSSLF